jgi:hypothetical protein
MNDNFLRNICDKKCLEAINLLETVNPLKCSSLKQKVIDDFNSTGQVVY